MTAGTSGRWQPRSSRSNSTVWRDWQEQARRRHDRVEAAGPDAGMPVSHHGRRVRVLIIACDIQPHAVACLEPACIRDERDAIPNGLPLVREDLQRGRRIVRYDVLLNYGDRDRSFCVLVHRRNSIFAGPGGCGAGIWSHRTSDDRRNRRQSAYSATWHCAQHNCALLKEVDRRHFRRREPARSR